MSHALTKQASQKFFDSPSVERFRALQQAAFASDEYDPAAANLLAIERRLRAASPVSLLEELDPLRDSYLICPRFHYVEARIRENLGEVERIQRSVERLRTCLKAISATGDGSKAAPFLVTFVPDQDDVVRSFSEQTRFQQLVAVEDRQFDVLTAHSGIEFWFDVTAMLARLRDDGRVSSRQRVARRQLVPKQ